jgi:hypothetical protein
MFSDHSKVAVLESKLDMYEDLSREMLSKLESAVDKISEGNARIAAILAKHDERIEQSLKTDDLIIKMIDEVKRESDKDHKIIHERIDKIQVELKSLSKLKWQAGALVAAVVLIVGAGSRIAPFFLTSQAAPTTIERSK